MPRYKDNDLERDQKNDVDRTVPRSENYYSPDPFVDLDFNNRTSHCNDDDIIDNQLDSGFNPCDIIPPQEESPPDITDSFRQNADYQEQFRSEVPNDFTHSDARQRSTENKKSNKKHNEKKPHRKHSISLGKRILIFILALILLLVGSIFPVLGRVNYDEKNKNVYVDSADLESSIFVKNILLLGVDARPNEEGEVSRSDTMMLISLDMKHRCIKMVSFLRDTWVYIPSHDGEQRLNAACTYGGYSGVVDTIEYNFGIDIDNYIVADFEMFKILVDSIGGVEIDVTKKEAKEVTGHPKRYGNVTLESGLNNLTGEQALAYCRIRKIDTDFVRTQRQRTVMSAIIGKMKSTNPFTLYKMAFNSAPYISTDMSKAGLLSFVSQAGFCATGGTHQTKVPFDDTWSYATIRGNSVISIDKDKNKELLIDYIYNKTSSELEAAETK